MLEIVDGARSSLLNRAFPYSPKFPLDIVVGLPTEEGNKLRNPFKLTIAKSQPVFDVAVEDIYGKNHLLPYNALRIAYEDTQLSDAVGPQKIVDRYCNKSVDAVMGMAYVFALAPVARMSQYWESGAEFSTADPPDGTYRTLAAMVHKLVKEQNWRRFHFFFNDQAVHGSSQGRSECFFSLNAIKNVFNDEPNIDWTVEMFSEQTAARDKFSVLLKKATMLTNIIILCASPDTVREIMLSAHELGMATSGEYVFINIDVSTGSHAEKPWIRANDTNSPENEKAKEAYRALKTISLRRSDLDEYKNFESRVKERAEKKYNYSAKTGKEYEMNNFISAFYDAVLLYAIALNETLSEGLDPRNGRNITSKMWNRTFVGITGNVSIDHNGDRYSDYSLLDLDPAQDKFVEVAYYSEGYPAHVYALFAAALMIFLCACGLVFFIRRYMLEKELAAMQWKIRWEDLVNDEQRSKEKKKKAAIRSRKATENNAVFGAQTEQSEALLRSNSRISMNSDKFLEDDPDFDNPASRMRLRSSSSGATRKISAMIDRKFSIFTRKKSSPTADKTHHLENNHNSAACDERNISSPSYSISNSNKKKSSGEEDYELNTKKSLSLKNRKFSFSGYSIKSGGSVETINMQGANTQVFTKTGYYKGVTVAMKMLNIDPKKYPKLELSRSLLMEFKRMKDLQHDHITRFAGACVDCPHYCIVTEYCPKGSLEDILENEKFKLDKMMKYSLLHDLVKGMYFLHNSEIRSHGKLKSSNCVVDSRFVLKVTDFGLAELHAMEEVSAEEMESHAYHRKKLWTAPELLRDSNAPPQGTQKADVYSFALIFHEMLYRKGAFYRGEDDSPEPAEILRNVMVVPKNENDLYRPVIPDEAPVEDHPETVKRLIELMVSSWSENPHDRPEFSLIRKVVHSLNKDNETSNLVDNLLKRMEQYANNLEGLELLHQLLPPAIADQLIAGQCVQAESYNSVTIYFSDIVGFTALSSVSTPMEVVTLLNDLYLAFDGVVDNFKVYKVETIGDAYMVVSGLPERHSEHASQIAQMSIALLHKVKSFVIRHRPGEQLKLRIGIHSGSVVAGVVGSKMPRYCLFGDTVNTSSRMESNGLPLKIHVSGDTRDILATDPDFHLDLRGEVEMKGKGKQTTYWLKGYKDIKVPDFGLEYR
uniref:Guanylate cyclase n=1 Tax=Ditylenchus dipsaci TaxID=166011 RepID=A0A915DTZ4_9BILA